MIKNFLKTILIGMTAVVMINCAPEPGTYYLQDSSESNNGPTKFVNTTTSHCITSDEYSPAGIVNPATSGEKRKIIMDTASLTLVVENFRDTACSSPKNTTETVYDFTMASGSYNAALYTETISAAWNAGGNYESSFSYETVTNAQIMNATWVSQSVTCHVQSECDTLNTDYSTIYVDQLGNPLTACSSLVFSLNVSVDTTACVEAQNTANATSGSPTDNPATALSFYNDTENGKLYLPPKQSNQTMTTTFNALEYYE